MAEDFLEDDLYNPPAGAFEPPAETVSAPKPATTGLGNEPPAALYPSPSGEHVDYLHNNPKTSAQFDEMFGPGAAVRHLAKRETAALPWPKQDTVAFKLKPEVFSTQDLLARSTKDPDELPAPIEGLLRDEDYASRTQRDRAAFNSLRGFYLSEPDIDQAGTWIDHEIVAARKSLDAWDQEIEKAGRTESGGLIYREGELEQLTANRRQAQARLDMAMRVADDTRQGIVTQLDAQGRVDLATQIAGQERRVAEMQDVLTGMQDGTIPASAEKIEDYQTDIQMERQSLAQMRSNLQKGEQRVPVDREQASFSGDIVRAADRALAGQIENFGRAVGFWSAEMGSAGAAAVWAGDMLGDMAKEYSRSTPAQATSFLDLVSRWQGDANLAKDTQRFAAESIGSALGSSAPLVLAAVAARSGGGQVAGIGTDVALNLAVGQGEMVNALREAFANEGLDPPSQEQMRPYVLTYGSLIGLVEATSDWWLLGGLERSFSALAKREISNGVAIMIAKAAAKGGKIESGEEFIQAWAKAGGVNHATGKPWTKEEFLETMGEAIENAGSAFIGGAALGASHGVKHGQKAGESVDRQAIDAMIKDAQAEKKPLDAGVKAAEQATVTTPEPAPERGPPPSIERFGEPVEGLSDNERTVLSDFADNLKLADQKDSNGVSLADEVQHLVEQDFKDDPAGAEEALGDAGIRRLAEMRKEGATFTPEVDTILDRIVEKETLVAEERAAERKAEREMENALSTLSLDKLPPDAANRIRSEVLDEVAAGKPLAEAIAARAADTAKVASSPAFMDVLRSGESFSASNHAEVAKRLGVDRSRLPEILGQAEKEGLVRKDPQGIWRRGPNAPSVVPSVTLTPVDRANAIQHAIGEAMKAVGKAMPQGLKVEAFTSSAELPESVRAQAQAREAQGQAVEGLYQDGVLYVSAFALSPGAVAGHELVHALKAMNLIDAREIRILAEAAQQRGLFDRETYAKAYAGRANIEELLREEAAAHMIEARVARGQTFGGRVDRILDRIQQFLERLSNQLRGLGYQSARDVANAVLSGDVARRGGSLPQAATDRRSFETAVRNAAAALPEAEREAYIAQSLSRFDQGGIDRVFDQEAGATMSADDIESVATPSGEAMFALRDVSTGQSMRRDLDALGFYSHALEAAKALKQAKGTPEQMLAQIKAAGVKDAEIKATGLDALLQDPSVKGFPITRDEIVKHLTENRVGLTEKSRDTNLQALRDEVANRLFGVPFKSLREVPRINAVADEIGRVESERLAKWSSNSLDPSNPTYRETVLHLPARGGPEFVPNTAGDWGNTGGAGGMMRSAEYDRLNVVTGHFSEPNIVGHMMTSMVTHQGKPTFLVDQIQSDWGQKLRDGGVRDEAKIASLEAEVASLMASLKSAHDKVAETRSGSDEHRAARKELSRLEAEHDRAGAELFTAKTAAIGHPLVNTTDQWTTTTLRHALRQAVAAGADYIAIPSGDTVLSYNPGDTDGMRQFYGALAASPDAVEKLQKLRQREREMRATTNAQRPTGFHLEYNSVRTEIVNLELRGDKNIVGIVPKNLRNILTKLDKASPAPVHVDKVETPTQGPKGKGFTLFPLTDTVKEKVATEGQAMFSLRGQAPSDDKVAEFLRALQGKSPDPAKVLEAKTWLEAYAIRTLKGKADAVIQRLRQSERNARAGSAGSLDVRPEAGGAPQSSTASSGAVETRQAGSGEGARARQALDVAAVEYFTGLDLSPEAVAGRAKEQLFNARGWHGTRSDFDTPAIKLSGKDFGFHFAFQEPTAANARLFYEDVSPSSMPAIGQRIIPLAVRTHKPLRLHDPGMWVRPDSWLTALSRENLRNDHTPDHDALGKVVRESKYEDILNNVAAALDRMGYDSIIYKNVIEAAGRDSMFVWHPEQVRSAFDYFDPRAASDKGFLPSTKYVEQDIEAAIAEMEKPMFALRQRPVPANVGPTALNRTLDELVADLGHAFGLTVRSGRIDRNPRNKGARTSVGQINDATGVVRLKNPQDIETLAGLGGHAMLQRMPQPLHMLMRRHVSEVGGLAQGDVTAGFVAYFQRYVTNRAAAENAAPNFTRDFEALLESFDPRLLGHLQAIQHDLEIWKNAPSAITTVSAVKSAKRQSLVAQMRSDAEKEGLKTVVDRTFDAFYTAVIDDLHPVKVAVDRLVAMAEQNLAAPLAKGVKIGINAAQDAYKLVRLARNGYQQGHLDLMLGVRGYKQTQHSGPSLRDAMGRAFGGFDEKLWTEEKIQQFGAYLVSRRFIAEWRRHEAGELENFPDKFSKADHQQTIKDLLAANPEFANAALLLYQYQRNLLTKARDAGFVSPEIYDTLIQRVDYVPVNRVMDDTKVNQGEGPGKTGKTSLLKGFHGSMRDVINPLESISKFTYELNFLIARNEAIRALDRLARAVRGGSIAERLPASQMKGTTVDVMEVIKQAAKTQGLMPEDTVFMIKAVEEALGEESEATIFRPGDISERGEAIIYLWEGGKRIPIKLADGKFGREVYEAITGLGQETTSAFVQLMSKPTQLLRAGVTLDFGFFAANFVRDQASAYMLTEGFTPFASGAWGVREAANSFFGGNSDVLNQAISSGMIMGGALTASQHEARVKREVARLARKGIKLTEVRPWKEGGFWDLMGMTETGTRVAVFANAYDRARADGLSENDALVEAAYTANDVIDYGRNGSRMLAARRLITFLNANLQGTDSAIRVAMGGKNSYRDLGDIVSPYLEATEGSPLRQHQAKDVTLAAKFWFKFGVVLPLISLGLVLVYKDDPEYQEIPEWMRNTHWLFKLPNGTWVRIPKPFELATSSLIVERAFEAVYRRDPEYLHRMRRGLFDLVLPPNTIPGLNMVYEQWANKVRFSGAPIESEQLAKLPPEMRFTAYTSEFSKWLARGTAAAGVPLSPARLDHAITSVSGNLGRSFLETTNASLPPAYAPRAAKAADEWPGLMRFTANPARQSQAKKTLIEQVGSANGEMAQVANGYKEAMERMTPGDADAILRRAQPDERAYALLMYHGSPAEKRNHPMERAKEVLQVTNGLRREIQMGKFRNEDGGYFGPSDQRVVQDMVDQIQMREARNALIVLGHPGYKGLRTLDTEPVLRELETKAPRIHEELSARLREKKVADFADVRDDWPAFKADLLAPGYAEDHPKRPATPAARRRAQ